MANILICDDDKFIRVTLANTLTEDGYSVDTVARMPEATKKLMENQYDLVILDVHIEGLEGIEPVCMIRSIDSEVTIVAIAENGSLETRRRVQSAGDIFHYFVKPIDNERFRAVVRSALEKKRT